MSTYLTRPVLDLPLAWNKPRQFPAYDLRPLNTGGRPGYEQLAEFPAEKLEVDLLLKDAAECRLWEDFQVTVKGRLTGFWLAAPMRAATVAAGHSATQFDIEAIGLVDSWSDAAQLHWQFESRAGIVWAQITAVTGLAGNRERVTIGSALSIDETWTPKRLLYVRFAEEKFAGKWKQPNYREQRLACLELPQEYAAAETGLQKVTLFHFWIEWPSVTQHFYFTNFPTDLVSNGHTYLARPIDHGTIRHGLRADTEEASVETAFTDGNPLRYFFPFDNSRPMQCEIIEADYATPDTTTPVATGYIAKSKQKGRKISAKLSGFLEWFGQSVPAMVIQPRCPYVWGEPRTCKVSPVSFQVPGTLGTVTGNVVTLPTLAGFEADRFAGGYIIIGGGTTVEVRDVWQSADAGAELQLTLSAPLFHNAAGAPVLLYPGCKRTVADCRDYFSNLVNYGGCPCVPSDNLSLPTVAMPSANGNKK
ncbi:MAG: DUF2163 domain-containing protein [Verrucomicrobia bacterium]|nr:DUF2163 domain-containing protein [Verrucomicrobiota bacterium]